MLRDPRTEARTAPLVVAIRVALAALALAAAVAGLAVALGVGRGSPARRYACPMHAEATSAAPGDCPICGMALEPVDASSRVAAPADPAPAGADDIALAALRASPETAALLRYSVAQARRNVNPGEVFAPAIVEPDGAITARLYRDELATLAPDERARFVAAAGPGDPVEVRRDARDPAVGAVLADVAFRPAPGAAAPPPGQVGWVVLGYRTRDMLVVRAASVLRGADGPYVLVFSAQSGTLARRRIETGKEFMGQTAVVGGLRDKEFVVMANAFSFDAERRLQAAP